MENTNNNENKYLLQETIIKPFKDFQGFRFDVFLTSDILEDISLMKLRIGYTSNTVNETFYSFIDTNEVDIIINAFNYILERAKAKPENYTKYNFSITDEVEFGCDWQKKDWKYSLASES